MRSRKFFRKIDSDKRQPLAHLLRFREAEIRESRGSLTLLRACIFHAGNNFSLADISLFYNLVLLLLLPLLPHQLLLLLLLL